LFGFEGCALNNWLRAVLWLIVIAAFVFLGAVVVVPGVFN